MLTQYGRALLSDSDGASETARRLLAQAGSGAQGFMQRFDCKRSRLSHVRPAARTETLQRLECAQAFIHANAGRPLTLDEVSRAAALSRFHLTRTFAQVYGAPPLAYHRRLRLEQAAARLREGSACATALADELGYASLSAFSRAFRAQFGAPPTGVCRTGAQRA
jgi:AraC-like DNA-binding protein